VVLVASVDEVGKVCPCCCAHFVYSIGQLVKCEAKSCLILMTQDVYERYSNRLQVADTVDSP